MLAYLYRCMSTLARVRTSGLPGEADRGERERGGDRYLWGGGTEQGEGSPPGVLLGVAWDVHAC